jgi:NAD(P)H-flavin reductase
MNVQEFNLKLTRVRKLSPTTRDFRFVRVDGEPIEYLPGQFYRFVFTDSQGDFERSYSIATFGGEVGRSYEIDLVISSVVDGRATKYLFQDDLEQLISEVNCSAKGPYGRLIVPEKLPQRLILVATSVGLAPYIPMLNQLDELLNNEVLEVILLLGVRSPSEFIYRDKLLQYEKEHSGFCLTVCYSREQPGNDDSRAFSGYVQDRLKQLELNSQKDHVLLCGNPHMIDDAYELLKSNGFGIRNVVREKYIFARESEKKVRPPLTEAQKKLIADKLASSKSND